jgi:hypothetical protein
MLQFEILSSVTVNIRRTAFWDVTSCVGQTGTGAGAVFIVNRGCRLLRKVDKFYQLRLHGVTGKSRPTQKNVSCSGYSHSTKGKQ